MNLFYNDGFDPEGAVELVIDHIDGAGKNGVFRLVVRHSDGALEEPVFFECDPTDVLDIIDSAFQAREALREFAEVVEGE
jgi:hypothetical protein